MERYEPQKDDKALANLLKKCGNDKKWSHVQNDIEELLKNCPIKSWQGINVIPKKEDFKGFEHFQCVICAKMLQDP